MADEEIQETSEETVENAAVDDAGATPESSETEPKASGSGIDRLIDVSLRLTVEIGASKLLLGEILQLGKGSVVELDRNSGDPADLFVNGRRIGRGDVTTVEDRLAVRIVELAEGDGTD